MRKELTRIDSGHRTTPIEGVLSVRVMRTQPDNSVNASKPIEMKRDNSKTDSRTIDGHATIVREGRTAALPNQINTKGESWLQAKSRMRTTWS